MSRSILEMEGRVIAMLQPLLATATTTGARHVRAYQDELTPEKISRLQSWFPAVFAVYGGSDFERRGNREVEHQIWILFACDKLHRGTEAATGGGLNPGTYELLERIQSNLDGVKPFDDVPPFKLLSQRPIYFDKGISVYSAEYGVILSQTQTARRRT